MGDTHCHRGLVHGRVRLLPVVGILCPHEGGAKLILGGIDGLLGWALKAIVYYLFPQSPKNKPS